MKILFFGITKDIVGQRELSEFGFEPGHTVQDLLNDLKQEYPKLNNISSLAVGVNQKYADLDTELRINDEVALIPPVSGG